MTEDKRLLRQRVFAQGIEQLSSRFDICMWPACKCTKPAIRAHSVQNSRVLDLLHRKGHVVMPRLRSSFSDGPTLQFEEIGRNKATTFTGLCSSHDHQMFAPIETKAFDASNAQHLFLIAYRAVLKEAHASLKAGIDSQTNYLQGAEAGLFPRDEPSAPGMAAIEQMMAGYLVHQIKERYDEAFMTSQWSRTRHTTLHLDTPPGVAVNAFFTTDLWSEETDTPAMVSLNILPYRGKTLAVFSSLLEHAKQVETAFDRIISSSGTFQLYELSKLVLKKCENIVLAPALYDTFSRRQKEHITTFFERTIAGQSYEADDPQIFIFAAIQTAPSEQ